MHSYITYCDEIKMLTTFFSVIKTVSQYSWARIISLTPANRFLINAC